MNTYTVIVEDRGWTVYTIDPLPAWVQLQQLLRLAQSPGRCGFWWVTQCGGAGGSYEEPKALAAAKRHRNGSNVLVATGRFDRRSWEVSAAITHWNRRGMFLDSERRVLADAAFIYWSEGTRCWKPSELGVREGLIARTSLAGGIVE